MVLGGWACNWYRIFKLVLRCIVDLHTGERFRRKSSKCLLLITVSQVSAA